jgi:hypothetical protein
VQIFDAVIIGELKCNATAVKCTATAVALFTPGYIGVIFVHYGFEIWPMDLAIGAFY